MNYDVATKEGLENSVQWTRKLFGAMNDGAMNDGAVWSIPRSGTTVRIDKAAMVATITPGFAPEDGIVQVIKAMGWTVVTKGESK